MTTDVDDVLLFCVTGQACFEGGLVLNSPGVLGDLRQDTLKRFMRTVVGLICSVRRRPGFVEFLSLRQTEDEG